MRLGDLHYYFRYCDHPRRLLLITVASAFVHATLAFSIPLVLRRSFTAAEAVDSASAFLLAAGTVLCLCLALAVVQIVSRWAIVKLTQNPITRLREALLGRVQALPRSDLQAEDRGTLHNTLVHDTERVDQMVMAFAAEFVPAAVTMLLLCIVLWSINSVLCLSLVLLLAPCSVLLRQLTASRIRVSTLAVHKRLERFSRELYQFLERMDLARLQSAEQWEIERQQRCATEYRDARRSLIIFRACVQEVHQTATLAGGLVAVIIGAALTSAAIGDLLAFFVGVVMMKNAVGKLVSRYLSITEGFAALRNIGTLLERPVTSEHEGRLLPAAPETIELHCARFGYTDELLLCDVNLTISRGTTVAITGRNGVGKSSLLYLLLGLHAPTDGRVFADGIPYEQLDLRDLRRHFGVVLQRPLLFDGTVRENLTFGAPDLSERRLIQAARLATADEFIRKLPRQYETRIGEEGVLLSGGQRQRLAIARALIRRPAFLILDEPTNHLDAQTIAQLLKKLKRMPQRPAVVLISHDQGLVRFGEQVYVLESGRLNAAA